MDSSSRSITIAPRPDAAALVGAFSLGVMTMGSIYRKTAVRPVPAGAKVVNGRDGTRTAKWTPKGANRPITASVSILADGREVVHVETGCFYAKYRDHDGIVRTVSTGCRDRENARQFLARLERQAERVDAGVVTREEIRRAEALEDPIEQHIDAYIGTLIGSTDHREKTGRYIRTLAGKLGWASLGDMRRDDLETWLANEARETRLANRVRKGRSARSRNAYQTAVVSFCNWCVRTKRLSVNPFDRMPKANLKADPRRPRRALTEEEFGRLIEAARIAPARPEARRSTQERTKPRRPEQRLSGPARADLYLVLVYTGLRINELADMRVSGVRLDSKKPGIDLPPRPGSKRREHRFIPLRADLAEMLRPRVEGRAPTDRVFDVPADLIKRFNADCKRAGIPKRDDRDRSVDIHSLRMTFNTWLAKAGVAPRIAQELMRHSDIELTTQVYTDPALFDLVTAVEALPPIAKVVAKVVPTGGTPGHFQSTDVNVRGDEVVEKAVS
jgi:integrase